MLSLSILTLKGDIGTKPAQEQAWGRVFGGQMTFSTSPIQLWTKQLCLDVSFSIGCSELAGHFRERCHIVPSLSWKFQCRSLDSADNFLAVGKELETIVEFMEQEQQSL